MGYTLRFPFKLAPGYQLDGLEKPFETKVADLSWRFEVEPKSGSYMLNVTGLNSEYACHSFLSQLWSGFNWLLLKRGVAVEATLAFDKVTYASNPDIAARNLERNFALPYTGPIDGLVNASLPSFYPSEKNIRFCSVGSPSVVVGTPVKDVFAFIKDGIDIRGNTPSADDTKLQLALDLFSAYWYEYSNKAKLLTLILALESLMDPPLRHEVVVQLLEKWKREVEDRKNEFPPDSDESYALESLERELLFKKEGSLRRQVRSLVLKSLEFLGHDKPQEMAEKAVWVYDRRSELVHKGFLPEPLLSKSTSTAKSIVELVLEARYKGFVAVD